MANNYIKQSTFLSPGDFTVNLRRPIDSRTLVDSIEDLTNPSIWRDNNNNCYLYKGIIVSVKDLNQIYILDTEFGDTISDSDILNAKWIKLGVPSVKDELIYSEDNETLTTKLLMCDPDIVYCVNNDHDLDLTKKYIDNQLVIDNWYSLSLSGILPPPYNEVLDKDEIGVAGNTITETHRTFPKYLEGVSSNALHYDKESDSIVGDLNTGDVFFKLSPNSYKNYCFETDCGMRLLGYNYDVGDKLDLRYMGIPWTDMLGQCIAYVELNNWMYILTLSVNNLNKYSYSNKQDTSRIHTISLRAYKLKFPFKEFTKVGKLSHSKVVKNTDSWRKDGQSEGCEVFDIIDHNKGQQFILFNPSLDNAYPLEGYLSDMRVKTIKSESIIKCYITKPFQVTTSDGKELLTDPDAGDYEIIITIDCLNGTCTVTNKNNEITNIEVLDEVREILSLFEGKVKLGVFTFSTPGSSFKIRTLSFDKYIIYYPQNIVYEYDPESGEYVLSNLSMFDIFSGSRVSFNKCTDKLFYSSGDQIYEISDITKKVDNNTIVLDNEELKTNLKLVKQSTSLIDKYYLSGKNEISGSASIEIEKNPIQKGELLYRDNNLKSSPLMLTDYYVVDTDSDLALCEELVDVSFSKIYSENGWIKWGFNDDDKASWGYHKSDGTDTDGKPDFTYDGSPQGYIYNTRNTGYLTGYFSLDKYSEFNQVVAVGIVDSMKNPGYTDYMAVTPALYYNSEDSSMKFCGISISLNNTYGTAHLGRENVPTGTSHTVSIIAWSLSDLSTAILNTSSSNLTYTLLLTNDQGLTVIPYVPDLCNGVQMGTASTIIARIRRKDDIITIYVSDPYPTADDDYIHKSGIHSERPIKIDLLNYTLTYVDTNDTSHTNDFSTNTTVVGIFNKLQGEALRGYEVLSNPGSIFRNLTKDVKIISLGENYKVYAFDGSKWIVTTDSATDIFTGSRISFNELTGKLFYSNGYEIYKISEKNNATNTEELLLSQINSLKSELESLKLLLANS